jgi:hypothetical protein
VNLLLGDKKRNAKFLLPLTLWRLPWPNSPPSPTLGTRTLNEQEGNEAVSNTTTPLLSPSHNNVSTISPISFPPLYQFLPQRDEKNLQTSREQHASTHKPLRDLFFTSGQACVLQHQKKFPPPCSLLLRVELSLLIFWRLLEVRDDKCVPSVIGREVSGDVCVLLLLTKFTKMVQINKKQPFSAIFCSVIFWWYVSNVWIFSAIYPKFFKE